ncbi:unnamed protein product [Clonostachys byssicola]|uniref:Uncharacterized protein n=1 Tax=Clonostachys byssicola TaxID=160290 RepID=A0A9N9Y128_9HYPO|nr:unnamed protein product [Clonostachys byssicola]
MIHWTALREQIFHAFKGLEHDCIPQSSRSGYIPPAAEVNVCAITFNEELNHLMFIVPCRGVERLHPRRIAMLVGVGAVFLDYETGTLNRSTSDSFVQKMLNVEFLSCGKLVKGHCLVLCDIKAIDELELVEAILYYSVIGTKNERFVELFWQVEGENVTFQTVNIAVDSSKLERIRTSIFVLLIFRQVVVDIRFRGRISTLLE